MPSVVVHNIAGNVIIAVTISAIVRVPVGGEKHEPETTSAPRLTAELEQFVEQATLRGGTVEIRETAGIDQQAIQAKEGQAQSFNQLFNLGSHGNRKEEETQRFAPGSAVQVKWADRRGEEAGQTEVLPADSNARQIPSMRGVFDD